MYNRQIKAFLSKINFALGRNPKVGKIKNFRNFIPEAYKTIITITADFELAWAWQNTKKKAINSYVNNLLIFRKVL